MKDLAATPLYSKVLGSLYGGLIGDAAGTPTEGKTYLEVQKAFGWISDFAGDGTDDTILRDILIASLGRTDGNATLDHWAEDWLANIETMFGPKVGGFWISVLHTARKLQIQGVPRMAALGNVPCSSSAMCMAPTGIVNACNPRAAAAQAYNLASLMNVHDAALSQDGAAAIAAAVAQACCPGATLDSIIEAAAGHLEHLSGRAMIERIAQVTEIARQAGRFQSFCERIYSQPEKFFQLAKWNSLETVPLTLALLLLAKGDVEQTILYAANFGRDADTMAAMGGAIAGALRGVESIRPDWLVKARAAASASQEEMALVLVKAALARRDQQMAALNRLAELV